MVSPEERQTINHLNANWIWCPDWVDSSSVNTAGRIAKFTRQFSLGSSPTRALLHLSADTRYKLYVNGVRVAVGPTRSSPLIWYYDSLDIAPYLHSGDNELRIVVIRYFASSRGAMPFERTSFPGLTVFGSVEVPSGTPAVDLSSSKDWQAQVDESISFPTGLVDDVFLHIYERVSPTTPSPLVQPKAYNLKTLNGDLLPWRLRPRGIPLPEESNVAVNVVRACRSVASIEDGTTCLSETKSLTLPAGSSHTLELQAEVHSTAFLRWVLRAGSQQSRIRLKVTYSEGYELEPRNYPFFRTKADRLDANNGQLIGPYDEAILELASGQTVTY